MVSWPQKRNKTSTIKSESDFKKTHGTVKTEQLHLT